MVEPIFNRLGVVEWVAYQRESLGGGAKIPEWWAQKYLG